MKKISIIAIGAFLLLMAGVAVLQLGTYKDGSLAAKESVRVIEVSVHAPTSVPDFKSRYSNFVVKSEEIPIAEKEALVLGLRSLFYGDLFDGSEASVSGGESSSMTFPGAESKWNLSFAYLHSGKPVGVVRYRYVDRLHMVQQTLSNMNDWPVAYQNVYAMELEALKDVLADWRLKSVKGGNASEEVEVLKFELLHGVNNAAAIGLRAEEVIQLLATPDYATRLPLFVRAAAAQYELSSDAHHAFSAPIGWGVMHYGNGKTVNFFVWTNSDANMTVEFPLPTGEWRSVEIGNDWAIHSDSDPRPAVVKGLKKLQVTTGAGYVGIAAWLPEDAGVKER